MSKEPEYPIGTLVNIPEMFTKEDHEYKIVSFGNDAASCLSTTNPQKRAGIYIKDIAANLIKK